VYENVSIFYCINYLNPVNEARWYNLNKQLYLTPFYFVGGLTLTLRFLLLARTFFCRPTENPPIVVRKSCSIFLQLCRRTFITQDITRLLLLIKSSPTWETHTTRTLECSLRPSPGFTSSPFPFSTSPATPPTTI